MNRLQQEKKNTQGLGNPKLKLRTRVHEINASGDIGLMVEAQMPQNRGHQ
jgi:hypothetical protein